MNEQYQTNGNELQEPPTGTTITTEMSLFHPDIDIIKMQNSLNLETSLNYDSTKFVKRYHDIEIFHDD